MDGGKSWLEPVSLPQEKAQNGHVAVSSDGRTWIWTPDRMPVYYTNDRGNLVDCRGNPRESPCDCRPCQSETFYALDLSAAVLYESMDGCVSFQSRRLPFAPFDSKARNARGDRRGGQDVYATPGKEGDLWIAALTAYIMVFPEKHSYPWIRCVASTLSVLEKPRPVRIIRRYIWQDRERDIGLFRSDDAAGGYVSMMMTTNTDWCCISGDPKRYGRVYVGSHGRGIVYADPY